jgi:hypothetical protein
MNAYDAINTTDTVVNNAKEKLAQYHDEAKIFNLTKGYWRKRWATVLHGLADRLEPPPKVGRHVQA